MQLITLFQRQLVFAPCLCPSWATLLLPLVITSPPLQDQLAYRVGEVKHLKEALRGRDARITALEDSLRLYELEEGGERTAQETVWQAEGEEAAVVMLGCGDLLETGEMGRRFCMVPARGLLVGLAVA